MLELVNGFERVNWYKPNGGRRGSSTKVSVLSSGGGVGGRIGQRTRGLVDDWTAVTAYGSWDDVPRALQRGRGLRLAAQEPGGVGESRVP